MKKVANQENVKIQENVHIEKKDGTFAQFWKTVIFRKNVNIEKRQDTRKKWKTGIFQKKTFLVRKDVKHMIKTLIFKKGGTFEKIWKKASIFKKNVENPENVNIEKRWGIRTMRPHLQNNDNNANIDNDDDNIIHIKII